MNGSACQKAKKDCRTKCDFDVNVDLDVKPKIGCKPLCRRDTEFDLELDFDVNPRCRIVPKKSDKCGGCGCAFTVKVDLDCEPRIKCHPCGRPGADFKVDLELDFDTYCKARKDESCSSSSSSCSSSSSSSCSSSSSSSCPSSSISCPSSSIACPSSSLSCSSLSSASCGQCPRKKKDRSNYGYQHYDWNDKKDYWN